MSENLTTPLDSDQSHGKPSIVLNGRQHDDIVSEAVKVVSEANHPETLFIRLDELVDVGGDERGRAAVRFVTVDGMILRLAQAAEWYTLRKQGDEWVEVPAKPDSQVARSALSETGRKLWNLPPLEAVTEVPTLREDGSVLSIPGYDAGTRLYYSPPPALALPAIPEQPSQADARAALQEVAKLVRDFPFKGQADLANVLAQLLTPVVRAAEIGRAHV